MPTQLEKLQGHSAHLLDAFLGLRERYAFVAPMIFDADVVKKRGSGKRARGLETLRNSLYLSCVQDVAELVTDSDPRTPSLTNILRGLDHPEVLDALKRNYTDWRLPSSEFEADPVVLEALRTMELRRQAELGAEFEAHLADLGQLQSELADSGTLRAFRTVRDKVTAHLEIRYHEDKYRTYDIGEPGLKWGDVSETMDKLQRAIELVGLVVRNASFAWEMLDEQLTEASTAFWSDWSSWSLDRKARMLGVAIAQPSVRRALPHARLARQQPHYIPRQPVP